MASAFAVPPSPPAITPLLAPDRANGAALRAALAYVVVGLGTFLLLGLLGLLMRLDQGGLIVIPAAWFYPRVDLVLRHH